MSRGRVSGLLYSIVRYLFLIYLVIFYRRKLYGTEHIPRQKTFIICANHIKWIDPLTVGTSFPANIRVHFMAKKELFGNAIIAYLLRRVGTFPVNRRDADFAAVRKAYQLLKEGKVVGLFPEGTRSKTGALQKAYNGAALIAVRSGTPILPLAIVGPYRFLQPIKVYIGPLFELPPLNCEHKADKKLKLEQMSALIMENIGKLFPANEN